MVWDWMAVGVILTFVGLFCAGCWTILQLCLKPIHRRVDILEIKCIQRDEFNGIVMMIKDGLRDTKNAVDNLSTTLNVRIDNLIKDK